MTYPVNYRMAQLENTFANFIDDHNIEIENMSDFDKRLHQCIEFVKEMREDQQVVKQSDLERISKSMEA